MSTQDQDKETVVSIVNEVGEQRLLGVYLHKKTCMETAVRAEVPAYGSRWELRVEIANLKWISLAAQQLRTTVVSLEVILVI